MANVTNGWAGRLRQALASWLGSPAPSHSGLDSAACAAARERAWEHYHQGQPGAAIGLLNELLVRLQTEQIAGKGDASAHMAAIHVCLGQIYAADQRPEAAVDALQRAITVYERLGDGQRVGLAAALDSLAESYLQAGRLDAALAAAERSLALHRELGQHFRVAHNLMLIAGIFAQQQRYPEAEACYADAFHAAQLAGSLELKATLLQQQGSLKGRQDLHEQAIRLFKEAVALFRRAEAYEGEMQTCNLLATAEVRSDALDAAQANYNRSRALAEQLQDRAQLAICAQNLGILYQKRAELAPDPVTQDTWLQKAIALVKESLAIRLEMDNQLGAEASYFQLGIMHWRMGDLEPARHYLLKATELSEALDLAKVYKNYSVLARIAQDRGDVEEAARWQAKCDAKVAALQQRG